MKTFMIFSVLVLGSLFSGCTIKTGNGHSVVFHSPIRVEAHAGTYRDDCYDRPPPVVIYQSSTETENYIQNGVRQNYGLKPKG